jgi:hypothetical protein
MIRLDRRRWKRLLIGVAVVAGATLAARALVATAATPTVVRAAEARLGQQAIAGGVGTMATPERYTPLTTASPVEPSAEKVAAREAFMERAEQAWAQRTRQVAARLGQAPLAPAMEVAPLSPESATGPTELDAEFGAGPLAPGAQAAGSFEIHERSDLAPPFSSSVNEPAVASSGRYVFYTNNWYAARSITHGLPSGGGAPWTYIDPEADMPDFCCDQDAIYDKGRDVFIWERLGISPVNVQNRIRIGVSTNGGGSFCNYDFSPSGIGLPQGFYDYPRLSLSNNNLYMTLNVFNNDAVGAFIANVVLRMPLDEMSNCSGFTYWYWGLPDDGWSPAGVENARETMYFGDNPAYDVMNTHFRVLWQPENTTTLFWADRTIAPYSFTAPGATYGAVCRVPGGANPCGRADQRVIGGVLARGQLDFFWNVKQGGDFAVPYVESAGFDEPTLTYNKRKFVWNPVISWFYAAVGADDREHVGMSVLAFTANSQPSHWVAIEDDFNPAPPPGWEVAFVRGSTQNWTANNSGDYLRARSSHPQGVGWIGTGYTRQVGRYEPHFVEWRRGRDLRGSNRFQIK